METFVGDTVLLTIETGIDLTGYTDLLIKFKRPNDSIGHWIATIDPTDSSRMIYTTDINDFNIDGHWVLQAHAHSAGVALHGKFVELEVLDPFAETTTAPTTAAP